MTADDLRAEYDFDYTQAKPNRLAVPEGNARPEYDFRTMRGVVRGQKHGRVNHVAEISYDLVMGDDMSFVEGTFRLPGGAWQIVIVSKRDVQVTEVTPQVWESGVTGVAIHFPQDHTLNRQAVEEVLSGTFAVQLWQVVRGPDSMTLR